MSYLWAIINKSTGMYMYMNRATHSQLLLKALDLGLECVNVLSLSLVGRVASISQLG